MRMAPRGSSARPARASWWDRKEQKSLGLQPGGISDEQRKSILFASNEYSRLAGQAMDERRGTPTRESVLDLVFEVRPLFTGPIPVGMEKCGPLQDEVIAAAADLRVAGVIAIVARAPGDVGRHRG